MPRSIPATRTAALAASILLAAAPQFGSAANLAQWITNGNGSWNDPLNWAGGIAPANPGDSATFGPVLINPVGATISLDGDRILSSLTFNSTAGSYSLTPGSTGALLFQSSTASSTLNINVIAGRHLLDVPISANANLLVNMTGSSTAPSQLSINRMILGAGSVTLNGTNAGISDFVLTGSTSGIASSVIAMGTDKGVTRVTIDGANLRSTYGFLNLGGIQLGSGNGSATYLKMVSGSITTDGNGEIWMGDRSTSSSFSAFTMSGGTITQAGGYFVVGNAGDRAVFNMYGGTSTATVMTIGAGYPSNSNSIGVANLAGGTFTLRRNSSLLSYFGIYVGEIGTGVLEISGSAVVNTPLIQYGNTSSSPSVSGIVNLRGGTLSTSEVRVNSVPLSYFNFNGGTLLAGNSTNSIMSNLTAAYVYPNGARIDDGGNNILITQPLRAPTGNGVSTIPVSGGTGYIDTPLVLISRGVGDPTGVGATAVANVDSAGNLTSITVTNPGVGYTKSPVITLVGGNGLGAVIGSVTLTPNTSGGLTKLGDGTLTLQATHTYTGATNVIAGTLLIKGILQGSSATIVGPGAGLTGSGTLVGPVTLAAGPSAATQGTIVSDSQPSTLTLPGGLLVGGTAGSFSVLNFDVGFSSPGNDSLALGAAPFTVNPGGAVIRLNTMGNLLPGNYTLMTYTNAAPPSNVTLDASNLGLYNATLNVSSTAIVVSVSSQPFPLTAYWTGTYGNKWNTAGGPASDQSNFVTAASGGSNTLQLPGPVTDVFFAPGLSGNLSTSLGQNVLIKSLNVSSDAGTVTIAGPGLLQIAGGTMAVASGSSLIINANMSFPAAQSWTNGNPLDFVQINGDFPIRTTNALATSGNFELNGDWSNYAGILTVASGTFDISAGTLRTPIVNNGTLVFSGLSAIVDERLNYTISGTGGIVLDIPSAFSFSTQNITYTGPTTIAQGTVSLSGFGNSPLLIMAGGTLRRTSGFGQDVQGTGNIIFYPPTGTATLTGIFQYSGTITIEPASQGFTSRLLFSGTNSHSVGIITGDTGRLQTAANSSLTSDGVTLDTLFVSGTHIIRPNGFNSGTSKLNSLSIAADSSNSFTPTLNLNNNKLILQSSDPADKSSKAAFLNSALLSGKHLGGVPWIGAGINSATVAADASATGSHTTTLALFDNADLGLATFGGQSVNTGSLLVTTALIGDANLDGQINSADLTILSNNWLANQPAASRGNLNFDAAINTADLALVKTHWQDPKPFEIAAIAHAPIATTLGTVTITGPYNYTGSIDIAAATLAFASTAAPRQDSEVLIKMQSLTMSSNTILDSANRDLLIGNTTLLNVETKILAGFGVLPDGNPSAATDPIITSSTMVSSGITFLVPIDADAILGDGSPGSAIGQSWDNVAITESGSVIVKYAYVGDADLDGKVDYADYGPILANFGQTTPGLADIQTAWLMGDLDLSGFVDYGDYGPILATFGQGVGNPLGGLDAPASVPEPASLLILALAIPIMLKSRPKGARPHIVRPAL